MSQEEKNTDSTQDVKKKSVMVIGHKNPDTDSICSALAYTYFKSQIDDTKNYVAARAGHISAETQYVLEYFKADPPAYLSNIGTRVKDMEIRQVPGARRDTSIQKAWQTLKETNAFTLPITDEENHLEGMITVNDIARSYMEEYESDIVSAAKTPYRNILETLDGEMVVGDPEGFFDKGRVCIAAANPDVMENYISDHDMVILGNRYESQLCAIEMNAGCIIVCLGSPVSRTIKLLAREHHCTVIVTPLDTYAVARLINQCMPVSFFMSTENLITFRKNDFTEQIRDTMSKKRYRDFPILDKKDCYVGMISRRNLLGVRRRAVILVDHNEVSQAVDNIEEADILEIIDHHRLGSLETLTPVYFRNQPVGCTSTIIYQMFHEQDLCIPPQIAGLMCAAILSDTLIFRSPTCTEADRQAANELAKIAGIQCEEFGSAMFSAGSSLSRKTPEEIIFQDFKEFDVGDLKVGIGQINSMNKTELATIRERLMPVLEKTCEDKELNILVFMLTDILDATTTAICFGEEGEEMLRLAFREAEIRDHVAVLPGIVSRKKQVVPAVMMALSQLNGGED